MVAAALQFGVVLILSAMQFLSDKINVERSRYHNEITSFASAIAITYLLFNFLPKAYQNSSGLELFIPLIAGFTLIHLLEKFYLLKYTSRFSIKKAKTIHDELHAFVLFVYHFVIGAVLVDIVAKDLVSGLLFLPPLLLFTTIGNWSLHHKYLEQIPYRRLLLSSATVLGALFAKSTLSSAMVKTLLINFAAGILLFIVVREALPQPKTGKAWIFLLGIAFYGVVLFLLSSAS